MGPKLSSASFAATDIELRYHIFRGCDILMLTQTKRTTRTQKSMTLASHLSRELPQISHAFTNTHFGQLNPTENNPCNELDTSPRLPIIYTMYPPFFRPPHYFVRICFNFLSLHKKLFAYAFGVIFLTFGS